MIRLKEYMNKVLSSGYNFFTLQQAMDETKKTKNSVICSLYRYKKKGEIISPVENLYIILSPKYQKLGCLPPEDLIPIIMNHWRLDYYVCLLSASSFYGSSHQKPQVFQVMVNKQTPPLICGEVKIEFLFKKSPTKTFPCQKIATNTGYLNISSPELTAIDLLLYVNRAGGLNHIALVISELIEVISPEKLIEVLELIKINSVAQRLGYIIEKIDSMDNEKKEIIIKSLLEYMKKHTFSYALLAPALGKKKAKRNDKWMIIENKEIEIDT